MNIPDKIVFPKGQSVSLEAPIPAPRIFKITDIDFTRPDLRWIDDPNGQTLFARIPNLPIQQVQIMGSGAKTPYNTTWVEQDARSALLTQLGLALPDAIAASK